LTGETHRTVKNRLSEIRPVRTDRRGAYYSSPEALAAVYDREQKTLDDLIHEALNKLADGDSPQ
jgi:hypothetical protein